MINSFSYLNFMDLLVTPQLFPFKLVSNLRTLCGFWSLQEV